MAQPFTQSFHFILLNGLLITTTRSCKEAIPSVIIDFRQGSSVDAKTMRWVVVREQDYSHGLKMLPPQITY